jgi:hypothetical protein
MSNPKVAGVATISASTPICHLYLQLKVHKCQMGKVIKEGSISMWVMLNKWHDNFGHKIDACMYKPCHVKRILNHGYQCAYIVMLKTRNVIDY